jgi:hypothetical protein
LVPSLDDAIADQSFVLVMEVTSVHVAPESVDVQMFPCQTVAASLVPSFEIVIPCQALVLPTSVHVAPESVDVQIFPCQTVAASLVPSLDDAIKYHFFMPPVEVFSVHVAPESVDVQMFPSMTAAASLVPSLDDVMPYHCCTLPTEVSSVHSARVETSAEKESRATSRTPNTLRRGIVRITPFVRSISKP